MRPKSLIQITWIAHYYCCGLLLGAESDALHTSSAAKVDRVVLQLLHHFDGNSDRQLDAQEWARIRSQQPLPDADGDGAASDVELADWLRRFGRGKRLWLGTLSPGAGSAGGSGSPGAPSGAALAGGESPSGSAAPPETAAGETAKTPARPRRFVPPAEASSTRLPDWFNEKDADGDGQLTLFEYSPRGIAAEVRSFRQWDADGDGVVTASEYLARGGARSP